LGKVVDSKRHTTVAGRIAGTLFLATALILIFPDSFGQERCGTVQYTKHLHEQNTLKESQQQFEEWLLDKMGNRKIPFGSQKQAAVTYQLPVVVHVIHNGEPYGTGSNIPDEQILSQIKVLNQDFQRLNADAVNTPGEFLPVAGGFDVEFVLAKRTPEGLPTSGIVRVQGTKSEWSLNDNYELKSLSYWPAEDYLNIWVTTLSSSFVGFAQFPVSGLPGLESSSNNRLTDGLVIDYAAFGSIDDGAFNLDPQYDKGRTTTHEMGHFLGLRHIWGDDESQADNCSGTDYVDDTPNQSLSTTGCPSNTRTSCGSDDMYMNYLDYTNDRCMNLFTLGQIARMTTVIENSPRRASLLTSPALSDPVPVANDLGIKTILSPASTECSASSIPTIEIENYGTNTVTTARIRLSKDGTPVETIDFNINLNPLDLATLPFSQATLSPGNFDFTFEILLTNGTTDGNSNDNIRSVTVSVPELINAPFVEHFDAFPPTWSINNPDQQQTWELMPAPATLPTNTAMKLNFYEYEDANGEIDIMTTPVFNLTDAPSAYVSFSVSYAQFQNFNDGLRVYMLTDCNSDLYNGSLIYEKFGSALATATSTSVAFVPANAGDWRTEIINLSDFLGQGNVQLAFVGVNDWGNNLYVDNIAVITTAEEDLALKEIVSPTPVRCDNNLTPQLKIQNTGTIPINSFNVNQKINSGSTTVIPFTTAIEPGMETTISLGEVSLNNGSNTLSFTLSEPNGLIDINPSDNSKSIQTVINSASNSIPLRENFDGSFSTEWTIVNPGEGQPWETIPTNYNQSIFFDAFDNETLGDEAWLVSPVLDFSNASSSSLFFDLSYAFRSQYNDQLRIMTSTDCGQTYNEIAFDEAGEALSITASPLYWKPSGPEEWARRFVTLDNLAGEPNARLAFVITNANGNNLYLDNLEFFNSDDPNPKTVDDLYLIYGTDPLQPGNFYITFNLDEPQPVGYEVLDVMGKALVQAEIGNVLNQTYLIDAGNIATGIYIIRLRIGTYFYTSKIFMRGS
jgi:Pregnancy-associated plasma protein-A